MKVLVFFACSMFAVNAKTISDLDLEEWHLFKFKYNKIYTSDDEEKFRMQVFMDNKYKIEKHNARYEKGEVSFEMGINRFSDLLTSEISKKFMGYNESLKQRVQTRGSTFIPPANYEAPDEVNWVTQGAVTPVKYQGNCASCWAFSSTGALEGQQFRKTGKLVSLSEQNLVDCSRKEGNSGCDGGTMDRAFRYIKDNGGIDTEKSYPYEGYDDKCRYKPENSGATETGFMDIPSKDEDALLKAVATIGPISVAIFATDDAFLYYKSGIFKDPECPPNKVNHGVLVVGYGFDDKTGEKYWLVKNSWGTEWGEKGYIRMSRDSKNICGIANNATYPLV